LSWVVSSPVDSTLNGSTGSGVDEQERETEAQATIDKIAPLRLHLVAADPFLNRFPRSGDNPKLGHVQLDDAVWHVLRRQFESLSLKIIFPFSTLPQHVEVNAPGFDLEVVAEGMGQSFEG
jgi:hypothetical protein